VLSFAVILVATLTLGVLVACGEQVTNVFSNVISSPDATPSP